MAVVSLFSPPRSGYFCKFVPVRRAEPRHHVRRGPTALSEVPIVGQSEWHYGRRRIRVMLRAIRGLGHGECEEKRCTVQMPRSTIHLKHVCATVMNRWLEHVTGQLAVLIRPKTLSQQPRTSSFQMKLLVHDMCVRRTACCQPSLTDMSTPRLHHNSMMRLTMRRHGV